MNLHDDHLGDTTTVETLTAAHTESAVVRGRAGHTVTDGRTAAARVTALAIVQEVHRATGGTETDLEAEPRQDAHIAIVAMSLLGVVVLGQEVHQTLIDMSRHRASEARGMTEIVTTIVMIETGIEIIVANLMDGRGRRGRRDIATPTLTVTYRRPLLAVSARGIETGWTGRTRTGIGIGTGSAIAIATVTVIGTGRVDEKGVAVEAEADVGRGTELLCRKFTLDPALKISRPLHAL